MTATVQADGTLAIVTMSLVEMLPLVEQAIKDGYKLDVESNQGYPQVLGSLHLLTMFPDRGTDATEGNTVLAVEKHEGDLKEAPKDSTPDVVVPKIDGRKKRSKEQG